MNDDELECIPLILVRLIEVNESRQTAGNTMTSSVLPELDQNPLAPKIRDLRIGAETAGFTDRPGGRLLAVVLPDHRGFHGDPAEFHVRLARGEIEASAIETDVVYTSKNAPPVASGRELQDKLAVTIRRKKGKVRASLACQREV